MELGWGGGAEVRLHTQMHTDEPAASRATGTLTLSQSNNAAAGTNRQLFNSHQLMRCHQVLLCAFPILFFFFFCISRILFAFIFIAQMLQSRRGGRAGGRGCCINADIGAWLLKQGGVNGESRRSHMAKMGRYPAASPCLCTQRHMLCGLWVSACRRRWAPASAVCVSQSGRETQK